MARLKWTKYIPHTPTPKQTKALKLGKDKELLFGGALGGGKSDFLLMCCLQYMDVPGYASAIFRKQLSDLKLPGALLDRAKEWLDPWTGKNGVKYIPGDHTYYFPTKNPDGTKGANASLTFCYIGERNAKDRYQSAEFQTIAFDEISQWETPSDYEFMTTRLRKTVCPFHGKNKEGAPIWDDDCHICQYKKDIPVRIRAATNPGGLGGNWIKRRFGIIPDPKLYPDKRDAIKAIMEGIRVPFVGTDPGRVFVPSYIDDNPHLDQQDYDEFLDNLPVEQRSMLKDGNWEARVDSRFKRHWARYYKLYDEAYQLGTQMFPFSSFKRIFTTVDPAGTVKEGIIDAQVHNKAPSYTVISTWGVTENNDLFWLNMVRFRDEVPEVVKAIKRVFLRYRPQYIKIEDNGVGLGPAQYAKKLGIPVKKNHRKRDKLESSTAAMLLMEAGKIFFPENVPWIDDCEDEVFGWAGLPQETDDIVDTLSEAAIELGPVKNVLFEPGEDTLEYGAFMPISRHFQPRFTPSLAPRLQNTIKFRNSGTQNNSSFHGYS